MASFNKTSPQRVAPCHAPFARAAGPVALTQGIAAALLLFSIEGVAQVPTAETIVSTQLGTNAVARGGSVAIGSVASATAPDNDVWDGSVAIGGASSAGNASAGNATAVGTFSSANGNGSIALGAYSKASNLNAIAIGLDTDASNQSAIAIGHKGAAQGVEAIAIGASSSAGGARTVAIGREAKATGARSVALGADSNATRANSVDIGNRVITQVGVGTLDTDAANIQQLRGVASALGGGASVNTSGTIIAPSYSVGNEVHRTVGSALTNLDKRVEDNASGIKTINSAIAAAVTTARVVSYDDSTYATVKFAGLSGTRLTNIAAGDISATSSDAINGAQISTLSTGFETQIKGLDLRVASLESAPPGGGGTDGNSGGNGNTGGNGSNGGDGSGGDNGNNGGDGNAGGNGNNGANGGNGGNGGNGQDAGHVVVGPNGATAIGVGSELPTDHALSVGAAGSERRITHVADGLNGTDAVNFNQLTTARQAAIDQSKQYTDLRFSQTQARIDEVGRTAYSGIAMAMAMPNITPAKAGSTVVAAGTAGFQGYAALGLGVTYRSPNGQMLLNGAVAYSGSGGTAARVQAGYEF
jgi:trimeric autotransporter adhesin